MKNSLKKGLLLMSSAFVIGTCIASCNNTSNDVSNESQESVESNTSSSLSESSIKKTRSVKISVFEGGDGNTAFHILEEMYEKINPTIDVVINYSPLVRDQCQTAVDTGDADSDIFFVDGTTVPKAVETYHSIADISELYNSTPKGEKEEEILIKDKIKPEILEQMQYGGEMAEYKGKYYTAPWTSGPCSLILNKDALNNVLGEGNWTIPNTTMEMFELCDRIVAAEAKVKISGANYKIYPFIYSEAVEYWRYLYNTWIAQFLEQENWNEVMLKCKLNGQYDKEAFFNEAKVRGYRTIERVLTRKNAYCDTTSLGNKFMQSQKYFLQGRACMYVTGDWIESEMRGTDYKANLEMIRVPVLSDLAEKIESKFSVSLGADAAAKDATLSNIIKAIDNGEDSLNGVSTDVFNFMKKTRGITYTLGNSSYGVVPECSKNKDLVIDFLRFMYTDEAIQAYHNDTKTMFPVINQSKFKAEGEISDFRKSVNGITNSDITSYIFFSNNDPIRYRGGLGECVNNEKPEVAMGKKSGALTADQYLGKERILLDAKWDDIMRYVAGE